MKKVLLAGGTGFIGEYLISFLIEKGYKVAVLTRRKMDDRPGVKYYYWNVRDGIIDKKAFENVDTIINLTGANIGAKRWTQKRKEEIINSRVDAIDLLYRSVSKNQYPIAHFISASATGYYGAATTDQIFTEESSNGDDFLAAVCQKWELAARQFKNIDGRVVILRQGVVVGRRGGIYKKLVSLAKWGINPAVGKGSQYLPWIAIRDLVRLYLYVLENQILRGVFNAVSSEYITMNTFARELLRSVGKKSLLPNAPEVLIKMLLGEMSSMLLEGSKVSNKKIREAGFDFLCDHLAESLR